LPAVRVPRRDARLLAAILAGDQIEPQSRDLAFDDGELAPHRLDLLVNNV
jgi:hypothetical protein